VAMATSARTTGKGTIVISTSTDSRFAIDNEFTNVLY